MPQRMPPAAALWSKDTQVKGSAQPLQELNPRHTVPLAVQGGAEYADSHAGGHHGHDAAAHAALCRGAHPQGEFPGTVVHPAGHQDDMLPIWQTGK